MQFGLEPAEAARPTIPATNDSGVDEQGPYLALEYVAGATAARLIAAETRRGQTVPLAFAEAICRDAAEALIKSLHA